MNDLYQGIQQSQKKILYTILLVLIVLIAKFTGAYLTKSLALFSDSWHLVTDLGALIISWWGVKISTKAANYKYTFGYYRYSILTALINNTSLILISFFILYKAVIRYFNPVEIEPKGMVVFAILGFIVNIFIIHNLRCHTQNANVKSIFLHFAGDALSDLGVCIGGVVIYFTGWNGIDTLLSALLACLILKNAIQMTLECIKILLEATPASIKIDELKDTLKKIDGVLEVRDIHVWSLSMEALTMTAHVCIDENDFSRYEAILHEIHHVLKDTFNIVHSTIQVERSPCSSCFHFKSDHSSQCSMCIDSKNVMFEKKLKWDKLK